MTESRKFTATLAEFDGMMQWIRDVMQREASRHPRYKKLELVMEEVLINVIQHGYESKGGIVEIAYQGDEKKITFVVRDQGIPHNPLEYAIPMDKQAPIEAREAGGLGIHLIRMYVDESSYVREGNWNVLTLTHYR